MKAPAPFSIAGFGGDVARRLTTFVTQVAKGLDSGLTFEENVRAEWREVTWIGGQTADLQIATRFTQPKVVLLAACVPDQDVGSIQEVRGVVTTDGAGGVTIADQGTGGWAVDISSNSVRITLDPAMASTDYVPHGTISTSSGRYVAPQVSSSTQFFLHVYSAAGSVLNANNTGFTAGFTLKGQRLGRPAGTPEIEWARSQGGVILRAVDGLVYGQRYTLRLLVVER